MIPAGSPSVRGACDHRHGGGGPVQCRRPGVQPLPGLPADQGVHHQGLQPGIPGAAGLGGAGVDLGGPERDLPGVAEHRLAQLRLAAGRGKLVHLGLDHVDGDAHQSPPSDAGSPPGPARGARCRTPRRPRRGGAAGASPSPRRRRCRPARPGRSRSGSPRAGRGTRAAAAPWRPWRRCRARPWPAPAAGPSRPGPSGRVPAPPGPRPRPPAPGHPAPARARVPARTLSPLQPVTQRLPQAQPGLGDSRGSRGPPGHIPGGPARAARAPRPALTAATAPAIVTTAR